MLGPAAPSFVYYTHNSGIAWTRVEHGPLYLKHAFSAMEGSLFCWGYYLVGTHTGLCTASATCVLSLAYTDGSVQTILLDQLMACFTFV